MRFFSAATTFITGLLLAGSVGAVPPPPEQVAADCDQPTYASDFAVCASPALLGLDRQMSGLLQSAPVGQAVARAALFEDQRAWFRRRSRCAFSSLHEACLLAAYSERIAVLKAVASSGSDFGSARQELSCHYSPWGPGAERLILLPGNVALIAHSSGEVLAVALDGAPESDWTPYVRFSIERQVIELVPLDSHRSNAIASSRRARRPMSRPGLRTRRSGRA